MTKDKINSNLIYALTVIFAIIYVCKIMRLNRIASFMFTLTFFGVFILWLINLKPLNKLDFLSIVILVMSSLNVLLDTLFNNGVISFEYLKKLIMFNCTIMLFSKIPKIKINFDRFKKFFLLINSILCIITVIMFLVYGDKLYFLNGIRTEYLLFNFENPNTTGLFLLVIGVIEYSIFFSQRNKFLKTFTLILSLFITYFIIKTKARTSLITLFFCLTLYVFYNRNSEKKISKLFLLFFSIWPLLFSVIYMYLIKNQFVLKKLSFLVSEGKKLTSRYIVWNKAFSLFDNSPIFGSYFFVQQETTFRQLHNTHLDIMVSYGVLVLILVCILLYLLLYSVNKDSKDKTFILCFIGALSCGIGEATLFNGSLGMYIYVGSILLLSYAKNDKHKEKLGVESEKKYI